MPRPPLEKYPIEVLKAELERRARKAGKKLKKLLRVRAKLTEQITELEALTGTMSAPKAKLGRPPGKRGRKPGPKAAKPVVRRKRGTFTETATEFILGLVKKAPKTTSQIGKKWAAAGRGGKADNTLTKLVSEGKVKREKIPNAKGSMYTLA